MRLAERKLQLVEKASTKALEQSKESEKSMILISQELEQDNSDPVLSDSERRQKQQEVLSESCPIG